MDGAIVEACARRPQINVEPPRRGLMVYRTVDEPALQICPRYSWIDQLAGGIRPGDVHVIHGDREAASMLMTQLAVGVGVCGRRSLVFAMGTAPSGFVDRVRTLTAAWDASEAKTAMTAIDLTPEAGDLRDLRTMIDTAIDRRFGVHRDTACVIIDRATLSRRGRIVSRAAEDFAGCIRICRQNDAVLLAIVEGSDEAIAPLIAQADVIWHLRLRGRDRIEASTIGSRAGVNMRLERDDSSGELKPIIDDEAFFGRSRGWIGGQDPIVEVHAILSSATRSRRRIVASGLPDRRIEQALALLSRVPFLGRNLDDHDVELLLTGDAGFRVSLGLPISAAMASSFLRLPIPIDTILAGEVGLDRRIRRLSPFAVESLSSAIDDGAISSSTRLMVAPTTARQLEGLKCNIIPMPTLDAALLQLWPDLH